MHEADQHLQPRETNTSCQLLVNVTFKFTMRSSPAQRSAQRIAGRRLRQRGLSRCAGMQERLNFKKKRMDAFKTI